MKMGVDSDLVDDAALDLKGDAWKQFRQKLGVELQVFEHAFLPAAQRKLELGVLFRVEVQEHLKNRESTHGVNGIILMLLCC